LEKEEINLEEQLNRSTTSKAIMNPEVQQDFIPTSMKKNQIEKVLESPLKG